MGRDADAPSRLRLARQRLRCRVGRREVRRRRQRVATGRPPPSRLGRSRSERSGAERVSTRPHARPRVVVEDAVAAAHVQDDRRVDVGARCDDDGRRRQGARDHAATERGPSRHGALVRAGCARGRDARRLRGRGGGEVAAPHYVAASLAQLGGGRRAQPVVDGGGAERGRLVGRGARRSKRRRPPLRVGRRRSELVRREDCGELRHRGRRSPRVGARSGRDLARSPRWRPLRVVAKPHARRRPRRRPARDDRRARGRLARRDLRRLSNEGRRPHLRRHERVGHDARLSAPRRDERGASRRGLAERSGPHGAPRRLDARLASSPRRDVVPRLHREVDGQ
jgi:hypothetical protein